jgi:RimJ/RimL family protein N-acetyltransferase
MTDVVRSACAFAAQQWKLVRITAHVFDFNVASARVLEKCGFELEGHLRKHHQKDGKFLDSRLYALVKSEGL